MDLMLVKMKNNIFPPIYTIIRPKVLTLCYPVQLKTLAVIYCNSCVSLKYEREKNILRISGIQNHGCNAGQQTCKTCVFHG